MGVVESELLRRETSRFGDPVARRAVLNRPRRPLAARSPDGAIAMSNLIGMVRSENSSGPVNVWAGVMGAASVLCESAATPGAGHPRHSGHLN